MYSRMPSRPFSRPIPLSFQPLNGVEIEVTTADVIGTTDACWEVITAGDVCYERPMADRVTVWLRALADRGCLVLLGDPGRAYLPADGLLGRAHYVVPTSRELEDRETRDAVVWEVIADWGAERQR